MNRALLNWHKESLLITITVPLDLVIMLLSHVFTSIFFTFKPENKTLDFKHSSIQN